MILNLCFWERLSSKRTHLSRSITTWNSTVGSISKTNQIFCHKYSSHSNSSTIKSQKWENSMKLLGSVKADRWLSICIARALKKICQECGIWASYLGASQYKTTLPRNFQPTHFRSTVFTCMPKKDEESIKTAITRLNEKNKNQINVRPLCHVIPVVLLSKKRCQTSLMTWCYAVRVLSVWQ